MKWAFVVCLVALDIAARADSFVIFKFTATPGQPAVLNGSTFTVDESSDSVIAWNFVDTTLVPSISPDTAFGLNSSLAAGSFNDILTAPGNVLNSSITEASPEGFGGTFAADSFVYPLGYLWFLTPNSLDDEFVMWPSVSDGENPLIIGHNIPGTWTDPILPNIAPDAANTFGLLLAGVGAAGFLRRRWQRARQ